jgi:hypothetical protein
VKVWTGFNLLCIGSSGGLFVEHGNHLPVSVSAGTITFSWNTLHHGVVNYKRKHNTAHFAFW